MRIGILTFANVANFGANLQALSTVGWLRRHGHEPVVLDWAPDDFNKQFQSSHEPQALEHYRFFVEHIPHTQRLKNEEELAEYIDKNAIEAVIIGSDAVLQHFSFLSRFHCPTSSIFRVGKVTSDRVYPNAFWGSFTKFLQRPIPVAVMSGSSQNCKFYYINPIDLIGMRKWVKQLSYLSVRDNWTRKMIKYISLGAINPQVTPDPVFAFNQNVPQNITKAEISKRFDIPDKYVLLSFKKPGNVSYAWLKEIKEIFDKEGIACVALPMPTGVMFKHPFDYEIKTPLNPLDWYNLIRCADGYIGENMHPIVVSLHNATPFFCFDNYGLKIYKYTCETTSKIYDIIKSFGLLKNRISLGRQVSPQYVANKIINFDRASCAAHAKIKLSDYNSMMEALLNSFKITQK